MIVKAYCLSLNPKQSFSHNQGAVALQNFAHKPKTLAKGIAKLFLQGHLNVSIMKEQHATTAYTESADTLLSLRDQHKVTTVSHELASFPDYS